MSSTMNESQCYVHHDWFGALLGAFLLTGIVVAEVPQLLKIILKKDSVGLSPWFLLMSSASSTSGFFNVLALQWGVVRCCPTLGMGLCLEGLLGVMQVGLQWILGLIVFGLYLYYYPEAERYEHGVALPDDDEAGDSQVSTQTDATEDDQGSGLDSGIQPNPTQSTIARFTDQELRAGEGEASSSAFARLVPSFWPMWKALLQGRAQAGPSPHPGAPPSTSGRQRADGNLAPIGVSFSAQAASSSTANSTAADEPRGDAGKTSVTFAVPPPRSNAGATSSMFGLWQQELRKKWKNKTYEWGLATALAWVAVIHLVFVGSVTLIIVLSLPSSTFPMPHDPQLPAPVPLPPAHLNGLRPTQLLNGWTTFLGVTGMVLAAGQYLPQLYYTFTRGTVGSLSIWTMAIQAPGTAVFIYSLLLRPGVNWTSILSFCMKGTLVCSLLVLCLCWKVRQARLHIDDFGHPLPVATQGEAPPQEASAAQTQ